MHRVKSSRSTTFVRSWGYENNRELTPQQEQMLSDLLDRYEEVQSHNLVTETEVCQAVLGAEKPFSQLCVNEANRVASHLLVRIALHTYFKDQLPEDPPGFAEETQFLHNNRALMDRVISRAGWDTAEYFMSAHPLDHVNR